MEVPGIKAVEKLYDGVLPPLSLAAGRRRGSAQPVRAVASQ
jgi:hypothetical protein